MRATVISGVSMSQFGRFPDRTMKDLGREVIEGALQDAGLTQNDVQAVFFGNAMAGLALGQECIRGETVTHAMGFSGIPVNNVENACATGANALHLAWSSVAAGQYETVLAVAVERLFFEDRARSMAAYMGGLDVDFKEIADGAGVTRTPFIDRYEKVAQHLMGDRGVTEVGLAEIAAKAHENGSMNPLAQRRKKVSVEEVLESKVVLGPLRILMCSLIGDGAAAAVVTSADRCQGSRGVRILTSQLRSLPSISEGPSDVMGLAASAAYADAGLGPGDMDFAEVHDATSPGEMISWVEGGFCAAGDEEKWARTGHTRLGGEFPVNPSGGLVARGHPVGATGLAQIFEVVSQLRGESGPRQIENVRIGYAQCGGGLIKDATAASCAHILSV